ncbi:excisionase family DNA binding protein [Naumannella cuiyingiana]|uniref:Excisionase family DNA binding protein n=1 Tax=Naumannella cuiyingiana TaxID=1347891 RepID=A0A7Z0DCC4_9ACTN|nr:helix-turn-helix domain-containing protein [Naumannella cuiyingiana]NYI72736.1 excisionase family DNA binding protein [Naumannella cuiyingiana]
MGQSLDDYPDLLTTNQVAGVLQVSADQVRKNLRAGVWPGVRPGQRDWRMRRSTVRAIIDGRDPWEHEQQEQTE